MHTEAKHRINFTTRARDMLLPVTVRFLLGLEGKQRNSSFEGSKVTPGWVKQRNSYPLSSRCICKVTRAEEHVHMQGDKDRENIKAGIIRRPIWLFSQGDVLILEQNGGTK